MRVIWIALVLLGLAALVTALAKQQRSTQSKSDPREVAAQLRESAFLTDPVKMGIPVKPGEAWGVVMDIGLPNVVVTVLSLADGTASIYVSTGGGYIGGQGQPPIREAAVAFVRTASAQMRRLRPATSHPLPSAGQVRFYVLTPDGLLMAEAPGKELDANQGEFSPLYRAGQEVITQFRLNDEKRSKQ
jgi:hypothetical protein